MAKKRRYKSRRTLSRIPTLRSLITPLVLLSILWAAHTLNGCDNPQDQPIAQEGEYGNLMAVVTNPSVPSQFKSYTGMDLSFNSRCHIPNWVSWELTADETTGDVDRTNKFYNDPEIEGCPDSWDYSNSGYDRGHMAPAGDMKWSAEAMRQSFLLTNVCPQKGDLNRGAWQKLEEKCRQKALTDSAVIIVCGPVFLPGEGIERIGATGVAVPRRFFKVILSPYIDHPTAIGFIMPNGPVAGGMMTHAVSVDSVEALTGHDFFAELPDEIETIVESQCDFNRWSRIRRRK